MKKVLISLANDNFIWSQKVLGKSALKNGIDEVFVYKFDKDIVDTPFYEAHRNILDLPRGSGYWIWKPYIILQTLAKLNEGDFLVYCDAGIRIIDRLDPLFDLCAKEGGILLFYGLEEHTNRRRTKRDCFVLMDADSATYYDAPQTVGSFNIWQKNRKSIDFLNTWLDYMHDERIVTDMPNTLGKDNLPEFLDHRHDQSVLSILTIKHNINTYRDPTQYGNHLKMPAFRKQGEFCVYRSYGDIDYDSPYGTLLDHHRTRDIKFTKNMKIYMYIARKMAYLLKRLCWIHL